MSEKLNLLPSA